MDPYALWHVGVNDLPKPKYPDRYRAFVFAAARWVEDHERMNRREAIRDLLVAVLGEPDG